MERRIFLTWLGLSFLASISPKAIAAIIDRTIQTPELIRETRPDQGKYHSVSNFSSTGFKPVIFYVASNGNDRWSGTKATPDKSDQDGPFATLHRARDAIRQLKLLQGGTLQQPVTVFLRGGTYFLSEPLILTPQDSGTKDFPIAYKAYPEEQPIISGGKPITNWKQQGDIWVANLPEVKTGKWYFRLLGVNHHWAIRARYPKFDPKNPRTKGWLYVKPLTPIPLKQGSFNSGVSRIHNRGDRLEWNIFAPKSGKYRVWLRYSNNMQAHGLSSMRDRTAIYTDNNSPLLLSDLPDTGSFTTFRWQLVATMDLDAGKQKIIWENIQGGGLNLDAFCFTDDPDWNPVTAISIPQGESPAEIGQPQPGKHLIIVHAETFEQAIGRDVAIFPEKHFRTHIITAPDRFPQWQNWDGVEVHIFPSRGWVNAILPVAKVNPQSSTIYVNSQQDLQPGNRFFLANAREALNNPGEWYLDKNTGDLLYRAISPDFSEREHIVAPKIERLIVLQGDRDQASYVENLHFKNLTFTDTSYNLTKSYYTPRDAAIWLSTTRQCIIDNCNFVRLGGHGIRLEHNSHENQILNNTMSQLGQGGVLLLGDTATQPFNNSIMANNIHDCGKVYKHIAGIYVTTGSGNYIAHNYIHTMPRYGISLKSLDSDRCSHNNIVEFNKIIDTNLETNDTGAIETLGRDKQASGNIIRFNFIRNVVGMGTTQTGKIISPYYTWGIYLDDYSSGTIVYGNIVVGTVLGAIMIHGGKDNLVDNNIFIEGAKNQIQLSPKDKFMSGNLVLRNIVICQQPEAKLWDSNTGWQPDILKSSDFNLYWHTGDLNLKKTERDITPKGNFQQWQAAGYDLNSLIVEPPFLTQLKQDFEQIYPEDFRLDLHLDLVKKLGIKPIPSERIGIEGFQL